MKWYIESSTGKLFSGHNEIKGKGVLWTSNVDHAKPYNTKEQAEKEVEKIQEQLVKPERMEVVELIQSFSKTLKLHDQRDDRYKYLYTPEGDNPIF